MERATRLELATGLRLLLDSNTVCPLKSFAVRMNLSNSTAMLITQF